MRYKRVAFLAHALFLASLGKLQPNRELVRESRPTWTCPASIKPFAMFPTQLQHINPGDHRMLTLSSSSATGTILICGTAKGNSLMNSGLADAAFLFALD